MGGGRRVIFFLVGKRLGSGGGEGYVMFIWYHSGGGVRVSAGAGAGVASAGQSSDILWWLAGSDKERLRIITISTAALHCTALHCTALLCALLLGGCPISHSSRLDHRVIEVSLSFPTICSCRNHNPSLARLRVSARNRWAITTAEPLDRGPGPPRSASNRKELKCFSLPWARSRLGDWLLPNPNPNPVIYKTRRGQIACP